MARSEYVYVVLKVTESLEENADSETFEFRVDPEAVFTVKHELVTWWRRKADTAGLYVWRLHDGGQPGRSQVSRAELDLPQR